MADKLAKNQQIVLRVPQQDRLPPNDQWENRFEIRSEKSDRIYIVAQNKAKRYWACSCPGWKSYRKCKHLASMQLPSGMVPHEVLLG